MPPFVPGTMKLPSSSPAVSGAASVAARNKRPARTDVDAEGMAYSTCTRRPGAKIPAGGDTMTTIGRRGFLERAAVAAAAAAPRPPLAMAAGNPKKAVLVSMLPKDRSYRDRFQMAVDAGFAGIEMQTVTDDAAAAEIKEASARTGLVIHSVMNMAHWQNPLSSDDA